MLQRIELLVDLGVDLVVAVADADGDDAAEEIQILLPSASQTYWSLARATTSGSL